MQGKKKCIPAKTISVLSLFLLFISVPLQAASGNENDYPIPNSITGESRNVEFSLTPLRPAGSSGVELFRAVDQHSNTLKTDYAYQTLQVTSDFYPPKKITNRFNIDKMESSLYTTSLLAFTALNVADYLTTIKGLKYEGLKEANPMLKPFSKNMIVFSAVKLGLTVYNVYFLKNLHKKNKTLAWIISTAGNIALTYVVLNNMKHIQNAQMRQTL